MRNKFLAWLISAIVFTTIFAIPVQAQLPFLPEINLQTFKLNQNPDNIIASGCVRLDGHCLFRIAERQSNLSFRIHQIEQRIQDITTIYLRHPDAQLQDITTIYLRHPDAQLNVRVEKQGNLQNIYAAVGDQETLLMTLSNQDTTFGGIHIEHQALQKADKIKAGLQTAREERQKPFLIQQAKITAIILLLSILSTVICSKWQKSSQQAKQNLKTAELDVISLPVSTQEKQKQKFNFQEAQLRIIQLLKIGIWIGALLLILGLYPYTRTIQLWLITILRIPLRREQVNYVRTKILL